ncbi:MAG: efflux RND transporter permease subunit [Candidatus Cloacimonetes bacterium]|nr:efflux RND transporter permease subunit [Candidatus Cloacimonadota bacterium]
MSLPKFSVKNNVLVNMIMIVVFIYGVFTLINMPKEEMPEIEFGAFYIMVSYRGVSPADIEQTIIKKIEDEIQDLDDLDYIRSTAKEGIATIYVQMLSSADIQQAWGDLNTEMDKVTGLPEQAQDPVLLRLNMREVNEMCTVALGGDFSANSIREIAEDFKTEVLDIEYISKVDILGTRDREIWIESDINKLNEYNLTLNDVKNAIAMRNINFPGGDIKNDKVEMLIRTVGEFDDLTEINDLVVRMDKKGKGIRIRDIATVRDTLEEVETIGKLNGSQAVNLDLFKKKEGNIISVMEDVRQKVEEFEERIPGLQMEIRNDGSIKVKNSLNTLGSNGLLGVILVFIVLFLFIGWRNALFAAWGIPFTFLLTFIIMNWLGITLNMLSLFALILVTGMVVDDAIIVLENVHRYREEGMDKKEAAIRGAERIMWPVIAAVTTTIAAFLPMLLMKGTMGEFMKVFPQVVAIALFGSLFECLIILPSHIAEFGRKTIESAKQKPNKLHDWLVKNYRKIAKKTLRYRWITVGVAIILFILALSTLAMGLVKFQFFPDRVPKTIKINLQTPTGTSLEKTDDVTKQIEAYLDNMKEKEDIEAIVTTVGQFTERHRRKTATSNAEIKIDLVDADKMKYDITRLKNSIRSFLRNLPGVYSYRFSEARGGPPTGEDIELRIMGDNLERLEELGDYLAGVIEDIPGTADIETSLEDGKEEIQIVPDNDKLGIYGITVQQISSLVNTASYGTTVSKYRGGELDEWNIVVRVKEDQIDGMDDLKNLKVTTRYGTKIPIKEVVDFVVTSGYSVINHRDGKRSIVITGNTTTYQENGKTQMRSPNEVTTILQGNKIQGVEGKLANFSQRFPGYQIEYGGQAEEQRESYNSLYVAFIIAVILIFAILTTQFGSYVQPLIVMLTIPFTAIGVIFGLVITGLPFSFNTLVAVVALAGIVVNDSLILVDFINEERCKGTDRWNSLLNAGAIRLRPILMTTFTTIAGFMPIILSTSEDIRMWKPMAVSIAFGLAFATLLTLLVIPAMYSFVDSFFGKLKLSRFNTHKSFDECVRK